MSDLDSQPVDGPRLVIKFEDNVLVSTAGEPTLATLLAAVGQVDILGDRDDLGSASASRLFHTLTDDELAALVAVAEARTPTYRAPNFPNYFAVDVPADDFGPAAVLLNPANVVGIESVYVSPAPSDPPGVVLTDPDRSKQEYLEPAPVGVDAYFAWAIEGGDGKGQEAIDVEQGWWTAHPDLPVPLALLPGGANLKNKEHGTKVLGVLVAQNNAQYGIGIAPHAKSVRLCGEYRKSDGKSNKADAITEATKAMQAGDVLLLELQVDVNTLVDTNPGGEGPCELEPAVFAAIELAVAAKIIVIEAAGNGKNTDKLDLSSLTIEGQAVLDPTKPPPEFKDSGAILVGQAISGLKELPGGMTTYVGHDHVPGGCLGERIDCYAWGTDVWTTSYSGGAESVTAGFNGTSSAAAIVAGVALVIQGLAEEHLGYRLDPAAMRTALRNHGTLATEPLLGRMPDLRMIATEVLGLKPDLYLRDNPTDTGEPHAEAISASPDIIVREHPVAHPQGDFGEGTPAQDDATLGESVTKKSDHSIYARVRNRGPAPARDARVKVYWSELSTLVLPTLWREIGEAVFSEEIRPGNYLTVSEPLVWKKNDQPAPGHYCFVGLVYNDEDALPDTTTITDMDSFRAFVRKHNNATWRNFNVVGDPLALDLDDELPLDLDHPGLGGFGGMQEFLIPGQGRRKETMGLEVLADLPPGVAALLEVPEALAKTIALDGAHVLRRKQRRTRIVPIPSEGGWRLGTGEFPAKAAYRARVLVRIPKERRGEAFEIAVRQLHGGEEVGRVTWRFGPRAEVPTA